eukprot:4558514-Pleurochrysis_carterae.AAC.1
MYQLTQKGIRSVTEQLRHTNTGNGGARRRAGASLSRERARPSSGRDRRPRPKQAPEHVWGSRLGYSHVSFCARFA